MAHTIYSDLDYNLTITVKGVVKKKLNNDSIIQSIKTILSTYPGERIMNPHFGSRLKAILFEPLDDITSELIETEVNAAVTRWDDRLFVTDVSVTPDYDNNIYDIHVSYVIAATGIHEEFQASVRSRDNV